MNGVAQITIGGQSIALKFGLPALRRIYEKMQEYSLVTGEMYNDLGFCHILYAGYLNACAMEDKPHTIAFMQFYAYVERSDEDDVAKEIIAAIRSFEDSKVVKDTHKKKAEMNQQNLTGTE